jgi:peroxisomal 2,4-dienoyl-CoA reductase
MTDKVFADDILQGKVAFVTGGGTGITGGIARAFARHGARVAITSRKEENLIPQKQYLEANGGQCFAVAADVRDFEAVQNAIAKTVEHYGHIDIVINGAAGNFLCAADQLSANGFGTVVDIDTKGTFNVCRAAFEELKRSQGQIRVTKIEPEGTSISVGLVTAVSTPSPSNS